MVIDALEVLMSRDIKLSTHTAHESSSVEQTDLEDEQSDATKEALANAKGKLLSKVCIMSSSSTTIMTI